MQEFLTKVTGYPLIGLYFLKVERLVEPVNNIQIESFIKQDKKYQNTLPDYTLLVELFLSAPHPMVVEFDEDGRPIFAHESRTEEEIDAIRQCHSGIKDYFMSFIRADYLQEISTEERTIVQDYLSLIRKLKITDPVVVGLNVEDYFTRSGGKVKDLI